MLHNIFIVSLSMSAVILLILAISPRLNKRYAAKCTYFIWLFIALRLLVPFHISVPDAPITIPAVRNITLYQPADTTAAAPNDTATAPDNTAAAPVPNVQQQANTAVDTTASAGKTEKPYQRPVTLSGLLTIVWLCGAVLFLAYHCIGYLLFRKKLKPWCTTVKNGKPRVVLCKKIKSPMLIGFIKPAVLLPDVKYSYDDLDAILSHETVHFKRKDLWYKLLLIVANAIHWFNPFVYMMVHFANRDLELSCDEAVIRNKSLAFRKSYSYAILNGLQSEKTTVFSTSFKGGKKEMQKRFANILNMHKKKTPILLLIVILAVTATVGMTFAGNSRAFTYENKALGLQFELPASWDKKYTIDEEGEFVSVYHSAIYDKYAGAGRIFYIERLEGILTPEEANDFGGRTIAAQANGYTYVFGVPTDVQYPIWSDADEQDAELAAEYMKMCEDLEQIKTSVKATIPDGSIPESIITRLYALKDTYLGDAPSVKSIVEMSEFVSYPVASIELQTESEPYGLTINYKVDNRAQYRFVNYRGFDQTMALVFALVPNVDHISCVLYDDYSDLNDPDSSFASAYAERALLHERADMEAFTNEFISGSTADIARFSELYNLVSQLEPYKMPGGNAVLTAKYNVIGDDCEFVVNSMVTGKAPLTETLLTNADMLYLLDGESIDLQEYAGSEIEFQLEDVRNFKTGETTPFLFLFDGNTLIFSKDLQSAQARQRAFDLIVAMSGSL